MNKIIQCQTLDGRSIAFVDEVVGSGAMKDVYFSPDKSYVVCFFTKEKNSFYQSQAELERQKDRLKEIVGNKWQGIFNSAGGDYWKNVFCWPDGLVEYNGLLGITAPTYQQAFFFEFGSKNDDFLGIKGKEKEGKWFASANNQNRFLDEREKGTWLNYLKICILIARAVRRMHAAGLAHSDLSYKNILIDPVTGRACVIDVDGLVVPGKYPPDVVGTPDFIAPEVIQTNHLKKDDPKRHLPNIMTDRHALAVLIYMYLLYRHPLRGGLVHDLNDPQRDENLAMGEQALFIEHPTDHRNRVKVSQVRPSALPWADPEKIPIDVTGPYLKDLFLKSFVTGLHQPQQRPSANDWETTLVKTVDLIQPCLNTNCSQKWYIFDNTTQPICPFCGTQFKGQLPVLNLYSARQEGSFRPDNHRLMVWTGQSIYQWHANSLIAPNERLTAEQTKRVGYFIFHQGQWWLVNENLPDLMDVATKTVVPIGTKIELTDGKQIFIIPSGWRAFSGGSDGSVFLMIKLNLNAPQIDETKVISPHSIGIWFTQAHSCQRDLVLAAKQMRSDFPIHIIASHQDLRPEITSAADIALQEPILSERVEWVLEQAQRLQVKLIVAGRFGRIYLEQKHRFDALGIRLMAGCDTAENVGQLHDKSAFTQICTEHGIPVVPATTVETADQLQAAYDKWSAEGAVCVKPVTGVFASGFWRLDPNATPFDMFHNSQNFKAHPQTFIESYRQLPQTPAYLVMPFLSGHECSVDMFCVHGEVRYAVARYKHRGDYQTLTLDDPAIDLGRRVACLFHCDGLVNMQARYNHVGELYILEVNPRPSGGISHTFHSGVNLVVALISEFLEHEYQAEVMPSNITVRNISQSLQV